MGKTAIDIKIAKIVHIQDEHKCKVTCESCDITWVTPYGKEYDVIDEHLQLVHKLNREYLEGCEDGILDDDFNEYLTLEVRIGAILKKGRKPWKARCEICDSLWHVRTRDAAFDVIQKHFKHAHNIQIERLKHKDAFNVVELRRNLFPWRSV